MRFRLVLVILLAYNTQSGMGSTESYMEIGLRIVSGRPAAPHSHPHLVIVTTFNKRIVDGEEALFMDYGHGTLLTLKWVLTAAHIVEISSVQEIYIYAGLSAKSEIEQGSPHLQVQAICERIIHPLYSQILLSDGGSYSVNDLAMLRLRGAFRTTTWVEPTGYDAIPEYTNNEFDIYRMFENKRCMVAGFGKVDDTSFRVDQLQEAKTALILPHRCDGFMPTPTIWSLCTFDNDSATYRGDSGTPLICSGCLLGVLSFGVFNLTEPKNRRLNVFGRLDFWKGWILDVIWAYDTVRNHR